jgi:hypothetical protein
LLLNCVEFACPVGWASKLKLYHYASVPRTELFLSNIGPNSFRSRSGRGAVAGQKNGPDDWEDIGTKNSSKMELGLAILLRLEFCRREDPGAMALPTQAEKR